jgi:hypothetical protein
VQKRKFPEQLHEAIDAPDLRETGDAKEAIR